MPSPNVNDAVTVTEGVYPLLGIGVSEYVELRFHQLLINVNDSVGLSRLIIVGDDCEVTTSAAVSIVTASACLPSVFDAVKVDDDGQGVSLSGGAGSAVIITAIDNVGLSKLIIQSADITVAESTALTIATPGAGPAIQLFENVAVSEQVYVIPDDYVFVTESVSVYFRQLNATAFDAATIAELTTLLVQGGTGAAVLLNVSDGVTVEESFTTGIPVRPTALYLVSVTESVRAMPPLMPATFDGATVAESVPVLIGKLQVSASESVTVSESVELRFSRLFIAIAEDISVAESNGISRPSQPWEAGAESSTTWNGSGSTSDDWEPGAVEETVWA